MWYFSSDFCKQLKTLEFPEKHSCLLTKTPNLTLFQFLTTVLQLLLVSEN